VSNSLVTIETYGNVMEARIDAGLLRSAGIPVHLLGAHHVSANALLGLAVKVTLQVPAELEQDAREVLATKQTDVGSSGE
jgi:hypothetical protein